MDSKWSEIERLAKRIDVDENTLKNSKVVLFGAKRNGSSALERLRERCAIYAFADNNEKLWGTMYEGLPVIAPEKLKEIGNVFVIITVTGHHQPSIIGQLENIGVLHATYFEFLLSANFEKFRYVYEELLEDEVSKQTFSALLLSYLKHDMSLLRDVYTPDQYFALPEFHISAPDLIFVDCGAYVGDTTESFITNCGGVFSRIYAFEPTEKTYRAMAARKERLVREWALNDEQIVLERKLVSSDNIVMSFSDVENEEKSNRILSNPDEGTKIQAVSLDKYFADSPDKPTFIKADIEGAETDMINGAENIIREHHPLLAVCIYHRPEDLYEIPMRLKELYPGYRMAIRHHMPNYHETVIYCY